MLTKMLFLVYVPICFDIYIFIPKYQHDTNTFDTITCYMPLHIKFINLY